MGIKASHRHDTEGVLLFKTEILGECKASMPTDYGDGKWAAPLPEAADGCWGTASCEILPRQEMSQVLWGDWGWEEFANGRITVPEGTKEKIWETPGRLCHHPLPSSLG